VIAGLAERKRPFSLLRLTGVPLSLLRRVASLAIIASTLPVLERITGPETARND